MKNKLVLYIIGAYFILLCIVLAGQLTNDSDEDVKEIIVETQKEDKFENAVILYIGSPAVIADGKSFIIDKDNENIVPVIINGKTYIPVAFLSNALNANVSWNESKREATIRYDNKAVIFRENEKVIRVVDNIDDKTKKIDGELIIINEKSYIPLKAITDVFNKNVFFDRNLIIITEKNSIIDSVKDKDFIDEFINKIINISEEFIKSQKSELSTEEFESSTEQSETTTEETETFETTTEKIKNLSNLN